MENSISLVNTNVVSGTDIVRCAIYARGASDSPTPDPSSISEQIRTCSEYAEQQGWNIEREFVLTDIGASGILLTECKSLLRLFDAATQEPRPFDCILAADISRLGRSLDRITKFVNAFHARGVYVQTVRGEFDSRKLHSADLPKQSINCIRKYRRPAGRQCPLCGR